MGRLLAGQFPQWAELPVEAVASYGTDHDIYRLGDVLCVRLPRIGWATEQAAMEGRWLPVLAPHLPLRLPVQLARGRPGEGYPYEWSVYEWLPGDNANGTITDLDQAADAVNEMLAEHSAHPHLAKQDGRWRLHHHPTDAEPVPMWTAIAADALARLIGSDQAHQLGKCSADDCARLYLDRSKNRSRRFCSTPCQNRVKAATFRSRRRAAVDVDALPAATTPWRW